MVRAQRPNIDSTDAGRVRAMLEDAYHAVKQKYYDSSFHGVDLDARYRAYSDKMR
jgi:hypothetical protein